MIAIAPRDGLKFVYNGTSVFSSIQKNKWVIGLKINFPLFIHLDQRERNGCKNV